MAPQDEGLDHGLLPQTWVQLRQLILSQSSLIVRPNFLTWIFREPSPEVGSLSIPECLQFHSLLFQFRESNLRAPFISKSHKCLCSWMCKHHLASHKETTFFLPGNLFPFLNSCRGCSLQPQFPYKVMAAEAGCVEVPIFTPGQETKLFSVDSLHSVGLPAVLILLQAHLKNQNSCLCQVSPHGYCYLSHLGV